MDVKEPKSSRRTEPPSSILVCINRRIGMRFGREVPSCAGRGSETLADLIELRLKERGLADRVEVERFFCFAQCEVGPNVRFFPGGTWFSGVGQEDVGAILDRLEGALAAEDNAAGGEAAEQD